MKRFSSSFFIFLTLSFLMFSAGSLAHAQLSGDIGLGFGSYSNSKTGLGIDNGNSANAFGSCLPASSDPFCQATPGLGRFFMGIGGDAMLLKHYGFGGELTFQPTKGDFGPLDYRQTFYDFDAIAEPLSVSHASLRLLAGVGGARTSFSFSQSSCVGTAVCTTQATNIGTANHFQMHLGAGVQLLLTDHIFIRPQFDFRYVPGFTDQFGRKTVPGGMVWIGYNFGG